MISLIVSELRGNVLCALPFWRYIGPENIYLPLNPSRGIKRFPILIFLEHTFSKILWSQKRLESMTVFANHCFDYSSPKQLLSSNFMEAHVRLDLQHYFVVLCVLMMYITAFNVYYCFQLSTPPLDVGVKAMAVCYRLLLSSDCCEYSDALGHDH